MQQPREEVKHQCPYCGGTGQSSRGASALGLIVPSQPCGYCAGAGAISDERCQQLQRELERIPWG